MEATVYNQTGKESGKIELPEKVFGARWRADLVHQVIESMRSNKRAGTADTKGRGEVSGGGKKPWKQKGTGRARHGSTRSPIWVGGGITHGPLAEKNYKRKISRSMRAQALYSVLSKKWKDSEIIFVDSLALSEVKTRKAQEVMGSLAKASGVNALARAKAPKVLTALAGRNAQAEKSFRNLPQLEMVFVQNLNPLDVLNHRYLLIENPAKAVEFLTSRSK